MKKDKQQSKCFVYNKLLRMKHLNILKCLLNLSFLWYDELKSLKVVDS